VLEMKGAGRISRSTVPAGSGFRRTTVALQCNSSDGRGLVGLGFTSRSSWWPRPHSPAIPCAESTTTNNDTRLGWRARKMAALRRRGRGEAGGGGVRARRVFVTPRFLINPNSRSKQLIVAKSRSTWALTLKTH
jgi:hypothetical protein